MSSIEGNFPIGMVKEIINYCFFLDKEEIDKTMDNLMLEVANVTRLSHRGSSDFNITMLIDKITELSKNLTPFINEIGNVFGHKLIIENRSLEVYKGPFLFRQLSLISYQTHYHRFGKVRNGSTNIAHFLLRDLHGISYKEYNDLDIHSAAIDSVETSILPKESELDKSLLVPFYSADNKNLRKCYFTIEKLQDLLSQPIDNQRGINYDSFSKDSIILGSIEKSTSDEYSDEES